jgi:hypothetical protein
MNQWFKTRNIILLGVAGLILGISGDEERLTTDMAQRLSGISFPSEVAKWLYATAGLMESGASQRIEDAVAQVAAGVRMDSETFTRNGLGCDDGHSAQVVQEGLQRPLAGQRAAEARCPIISKSDETVVP